MTRSEMSDDRPDRGIRWEQVRDGLPAAAGELLETIQQAYVRDPGNPARAIDRELEAKLVDIQQRFERLKGAQA